MKELIIDASTNLLYIGLINEKETDDITRIGKNDNAAYIVVMIKDLLERNNLKIDDIEIIIVGVGPGSYTGARVAVTVAKMLAYTKNIKLKTISSLNLLSTGYGNVLSAIDARRGYYFVGKFENGKTIIKDDYLAFDEIKNEKNLIIITPETIKVDLHLVSENASLNENVHELEPNYLRKTEAETNYDKKNDHKWYC